MAEDWRCRGIYDDHSLSGKPEYVCYQDCSVFYPYSLFSSILDQALVVVAGGGPPSGELGRVYFALCVLLTVSQYLSVGPGRASPQIKFETTPAHT